MFARSLTADTEFSSSHAADLDQDEAASLEQLKEEYTPLIDWVKVNFQKKIKDGAPAGNMLLRGAWR